MCMRKSGVGGVASVPDLTLQMLRGSHRCAQHAFNTTRSMHACQTCHQPPMRSTLKLQGDKEGTASTGWLQQQQLQNRAPVGERPGWRQSAHLAGVPPGRGPLGWQRPPPAGCVSCCSPNIDVRAEVRVVLPPRQAHHCVPEHACCLALADIDLEASQQCLDCILFAAHLIMSSMYLHQHAMLTSSPTGTGMGHMRCPMTLASTGMS